MLNADALALRNAALHNLDRYDHTQRPDVHALAVEVFDQAIEDAVEAWRAHINADLSDPTVPFVRQIDMFAGDPATADTLSLYDLAVDKLGFQLVPAELQADVELLDGHQDLPQRVRAAICQAGITHACEKAKGIDAQLLEGYFSGLEVTSLSKEQTWGTHENTGLTLSFSLYPIVNSGPAPEAEDETETAPKPDPVKRIEEAPANQTATRACCTQCC